MLSKKEIEAIAKKIAETVKVKEIILFGSYAKNVVTEDSDVDLCILVEDENVEKLELDRKIRKVLYETNNYKMKNKQ